MPDRGITVGGNPGFPLRCSNVLTSNIQRLALERKTQFNVFRLTLSWTGFAGRLLCDLLSLPGRFLSLISFFVRLGFSHVFTLLGRPVKALSFPVVHMRICFFFHHTTATAWCRRVG